MRSALLISYRAFPRQKTPGEEATSSEALHGGEWLGHYVPGNTLSLWYAKAAPRWGDNESSSVKSPSEDLQPPLRQSFASHFRLRQEREMPGRVKRPRRCQTSVAYAKCTTEPSQSCRLHEVSYSARARSNLRKLSLIRDVPSLAWFTSPRRWLLAGHLWSYRRWLLRVDRALRASGSPRGTSEAKGQSENMMVNTLPSETKDTLCISYSRRFLPVPSILGAARSVSFSLSSLWFYCFAANL